MAPNDVSILLTFNLTLINATGTAFPLCPSRHSNLSATKVKPPDVGRLVYIQLVAGGDSRRGVLYSDPNSGGRVQSLLFQTTDALILNRRRLHHPAASMIMFLYSFGSPVEELKRCSELCRSIKKRSKYFNRTRPAAGVWLDLMTLLGSNHLEALMRR